jgi:hypothetical protein
MTRVRASVPQEDEGTRTVLARKLRPTVQGTGNKAYELEEWRTEPDGSTMKHHG